MQVLLVIVQALANCHVWRQISTLARNAATALTLIWICSESFAAPADVDLNGLGNSREWRMILLYHPTLWGGDEGLIDSPDFFLDPVGKTNPEAELRTFLRIVLTEVSRQHPQEICRFPRRYDWVSKHVPNLPPIESFRETCNWSGSLRYLGIGAAYIDFSSYFLESPASYFGHLFVRLSKMQGKVPGNPYLDPVLNFSAVNSDASFLYYIIGGLTGAFHGIFEILPMHIKLQQYGNSESRDIWEYQLNLNPEELRHFVLSIDELLPFYSDYYYLSRNCAFLVGKILESVRSTFHLSRRLRLWSTPVDMLQRIVTEFSQATEPNFFPSNRFLYGTRFEQLNNIEQSQFRDVVKLESLDPIATMPAEVQAKVLDTVIEYVDFDNRLAGPEVPDHFKTLRTLTLLARAKNPTITRPQFDVPKDENPALSIPEQAVGFGVIASGESKGALLSWRPTLRDIISDHLGFKPGIGMEMFGVRAIANASSLDLLAIDVLKIENYQPSLPLAQRNNLNIRVGYGHWDDISTNPKGPFFRLGMNRSFNVFDQIPFAELGIALHRTIDSEFEGMDLDLIPRLGAFMNVGRFASLITDLDLRRSFQKPETRALTGGFKFGIPCLESGELSGSVRWIDKIRVAELSYRKFL
jgi:hypothetical protein